MANLFWNLIPVALENPTLDELYSRLRDLECFQVKEWMMVILYAIMQLESQGEGRESAMETVLMVGYTSDEISNQKQTRWLSWSTDGGLRGFDLAINNCLSNTTEYGAGELPLPTRPTTRKGGPICVEDSIPTKRRIISRHHQTMKGNRKGPKGRDQAILERDQMIAELDQVRKLQEETETRNQLKSELGQVQKLQQETTKGREWEAKTPSEPLVTQSRSESKMEVDETPRATSCFNFDRVAQDQMREALET